MTGEPAYQGDSSELDQPELLGLAALHCHVVRHVPESSCGMTDEDGMWIALAVRLLAVQPADTGSSLVQQTALRAVASQGHLHTRQPPGVIQLSRPIVS